MISFGFSKTSALLAKMLSRAFWGGGGNLEVFLLNLSKIIKSCYRILFFSKPKDKRKTLESWVK